MLYAAIGPFGVFGVFGKNPTNNYAPGACPFLGALLYHYSIQTVHPMTRFQIHYSGHPEVFRSLRERESFEFPIFWSADPEVMINGFKYCVRVHFPEEQQQLSI